MSRQIKIWVWLLAMGLSLNFEMAAVSAQTTTPEASGNIAPLTPDAVNAVQQQRQQLVQDFLEQLEAAQQENQAAVVADFQQQLNDLMASLLPPPLTPDQQAQADAQQLAAHQAWIQSLPLLDQQVFNAMQQRQQLVQQLATAPADQQASLVTQLGDATAQQDQALQIQMAAQPPPVVPSSTVDAASAQAEAANLALLPPEMQAEIQAANQRKQAIQAAMLLPEDQQAAAMLAIQAQTPPLPVNDSTTTLPASLDSTDTASASDSADQTSSPSTDPTTGQP